MPDTLFGRLALLLIAAVIVSHVLALVSYSAQDAAWSTSGARDARSVANWAGRFGAWLADGSYFALGFSVWWCVAAGVRAWLSSLARWMRGGEVVAGAPVAVPISWEELATGVDPSAFTVQTVPPLLAKRKDPWRDYATTKQTITLAQLRALTREED